MRITTRLAVSLKFVGERMEHKEIEMTSAAEYVLACQSQTSSDGNDSVELLADFLIRSWRDE